MTSCLSLCADWIPSKYWHSDYYVIPAPSACRWDSSLWLHLYHLKCWHTVLVKCDCVHMSRNSCTHFDHNCRPILTYDVWVWTALLCVAIKFCIITLYVNKNYSLCLYHGLHIQIYVATSFFSWHWPTVIVDISWFCSLVLCITVCSFCRNPVCDLWVIQIQILYTNGADRFTESKFPLLDVNINKHGCLKC